MKYFKKYPIFFVLMLLLCASFAGGVGYVVYLNLQQNAQAAKLNRAMSEYRNALGEDPTQAAIDASQSNIDKLKGYLDFLQKDLTRASSSIFKPLSGTEGYQLVEQLRGLVNNWRKEARSKDIGVSDDMDFGFKKYVEPNAEPPKESSVLAIWKQACVLDYINQKLFACKSEKSPMAILSVQRELISDEIVKADPKRRARSTRAAKDDTKGDNFKIEDAITARKEGSLDTIAYRFIFTGHTDVLRRFLNQLKDFDAMLVVRSIGVRPADMMQVAAETAPEVSSSDGGAFGSIFGAEQSTEQQAQPAGDGTVTANNRTPVVTDNLSEFTVVIEYVEVVNEAPQKAADQGDAKETDNK